MKYLLPLVLFFISCNDTTPKRPATIELEVQEIGVGGPKAGTVVAIDSMLIEDELGDFHFTVKVVATETSFRGTYDVIAYYGVNDAISDITFPKGSKPVKPAIRKGDGEHSYIIGFKYGDDPEFYDFYLVEGGKKQMTMKYLKAYELP